MPALSHETVFINLPCENVLTAQSVQSQTVQLQVSISIQSEQILMDIPREDGDSVRVWVRATDVMGNTKTDSVLVHVDSSPPVIQHVQLRTTPSEESVHPT